MANPVLEGEHLFVDTDRLIHWLKLCSIVLFAAGGLLFFGALAMPTVLPPSILPISLVVFLGSATIWLCILVDRMWRSLLGRPRQRRSFLAPMPYVCPTCGYMLRGVEGIFCPECGTVRPAPIDGDEPDD